MSEYNVSDAIDDFLGESEDNSEDIVYSITSFGADFLVDGLISRLAKGDIFIPDFQRGYVWKTTQASRFIESILLGLPIPGIFLYQEEETNKLITVVGLQRLTTLQSFHAEFLPGSKRKFELQKVQTKYEGKSFTSLDASDQRKFLDTVIHATIIKQNSPKDDQSSIYHIFERLNTGGTPLQPQEVRSALYHGKFLDLLKELNDDPSWRTIYGEESKRAKDRELILRFFSLLYRQKSYTAPMKKFLNSFSKANRELGIVKADRLTADFTKTTAYVAEALKGGAFRPIRSLNAAALDAVMVVVAEHKLYDKLSTEAFRERYSSLIADSDFMELISRSTADEQRVTSRIRTAASYLTA